MPLSTSSTSSTSSKLPPAYRWLTQLGTLPRMVREALALLGTAELAGAANSPVIMAWAEEVGAAMARGFAADAVPWCGLFMAVIAIRAGKTPPPGPLWAMNWTRFGIAADRPMLGDVLVFRRAGGGGHVGLYVGEDANAFHVLGGNQADRVGFARIDKVRLRAARRPPYRSQPASVQVCMVKANGRVSTNEA